MQVGTYPYIVLAGNSQSNKESNDFGSTVLCLCDSTSDFLGGMRFLKISVDGVSCDSKWLQDTIRKFFCGKCQHVGITDPNQNIKYNRYHNFRGSCTEFMGGYLFDTGLLHLAGVSHNLWFPEEFV